MGYLSVAKKIKHNFFHIAKNTKQLWVDILLVIITLLLVIGLFVFKSDHIHAGYNLLFFYAVLITVFQLFRLFAAIIFPTVLRHTSYSNKDSILNYWPVVTIVVPCMNEQDAIFNTLEKCFEAEYPKEKLEVIVINDGSTDNTIVEINKAKKKYPKLVVIDWEVNK